MSKLNPYASKTVYFGVSIPDDTHYYRQMVGYLAGLGTTNVEEWLEAVDFVVMNDQAKDKAAIEQFLIQKIPHEPNTKAYTKAQKRITNKIKKLKPLSLAQFVESTNFYTFPPNFKPPMIEDIPTIKIKHEAILEYQNFVAIDFETANNERISACMIGIVVVENMEIVSKQSFYIKPPNEVTFSNFHSRIHGITAQDVAHAPNFEELWESDLKVLINNQMIMLHNASMDASILKQLFAYYDIEDYFLSYIDTMQVAKRGLYPPKLKDLSAYFGHTLTDHHNPIADAEACAIVAMELQKKVPIIEITGIIEHNPKPKQKNGFEYGKFDDRRIKSESKVQVKMPENGNYFWNKKVVITGIFETLERQEIADYLQSVGSDVNGSISKKTNVVIIVVGAGPSKMEKIKALQAEGYDIKLMQEEEFLMLKN